MSAQYACYTENDTCEGMVTQMHVMKPALVLLVERMIATAPAGRLLLGVTLTDLRRQKGDGTGHIAGELT